MIIAKNLNYKQILKLKLFSNINPKEFSPKLYTHLFFGEKMAFNWNMAYMFFFLTVSFLWYIFLLFST